MVFRFVKSAGLCAAALLDMSASNLKAAIHPQRSICNLELIPQVCRAQLEWLTSEIEAVRLVGLGLAVSGLSGRLEAPRT